MCFWYTPQAAKLLRTAFSDFDRENYVLPDEVQLWLSQCAAAPAGTEPVPLTVGQRNAPAGMLLIYIAQIGADE